MQKDDLLVFPCKHTRRCLLVMLFLALFCIAGCGNNVEGAAGAQDTDAMKSRLVNEIGEQVIIKSYQGFKQQAADLNLLAQKFCQAVDQSGLEALQTQWRASMAAWMRTESFRLGPVVDELLDYKVFFLPVNPNQIEDIVAGTEPESISASYLLNGSVARKGLPAIEYLIFPSSDDSQTVLEVFTHQSGVARRRCDYLQAVTEDLEINASALLNAWVGSETGYLMSWKNAGQTSEVYTTLQQALDTLVNSMAASLETIKDKKLGDPAGLGENKSPKASKVESLRSLNSLANIKNNLMGLYALYLNTANSHDYYGFDDYLNDAGAVELDRKIKQQFALVMKAVERISEPLSQAVLSDTDHIRTASEQIRELLRLMKQEMASELGVIIGFNSADGD